MVPISIHLSKANTHDSTLIMDALNNSTIKIIRSRLITDKGYINPTVKKKLRRTNNISLIYPYRKNQNKKNTSYENNLLKKRHIVENFFSWLKNIDVSNSGMIVHVYLILILFTLDALILLLKN
jgi:transposase